MNALYALAWLTPLLLGSGLVAVLAGKPRSGSDWAATLGCGFVLGTIFCSIAVATLGRIDVARIVPSLAPILLPVGIGAWAWVLWPREGGQDVASARARLHPALWILVGLLALHAWLIADEILLRPMYPWDAWAAWLLKPKAWMLGGHIDRFVGFDAWLSDATGTLRTTQTWSYPEALGRIAIWFASAWGEWNAAVVGSVWFALWIALLAGSYGQLCALGLAADRALVATYALGSLPLINVHVALAGYADLWIAVLIAFACLAWMRGLESGSRGSSALGWVFASMLPLVKLEGGIWLAILGGSMLYAQMPRRLRRIALAAAPFAGAGIIAAYLLRWPLIAPALDRIGLSSDTGALLAHAPGVIAAAAEGMLSQYNWHLFWFAVALAVAVRFAQLRGSPSLRAYGLFLVLGSVFLFALFVLTPAGQWAESYTAVNRLSLQIVPAMLAFAALLWREAETGVSGTPSFGAWSKLPQPRNNPAPLTP